MTGPPTLFFDGKCNFCNGTVQFVADRDFGELRFASLQSDYAGVLLREIVGVEEAKRLRAGATGEGDPDSLVFVEDDRAYVGSEGALRVARHLRAPWRWLGALAGVVPRVVRDALYRGFARHRYRWFGKTETCRIPTPELRSRFLG